MTQEKGSGMTREKRGGLFIGAVFSIGARVHFCKEEGNIYLSETAVAAHIYLVRLQHSPVAPPSHRINVDMEQVCHFTYRQHRFGAAFNQHNTRFYSTSNLNVL